MGSLKLRLGSDGRAGDVFHSGTLLAGQPAKGAAFDAWTYDPLRTDTGLAEVDDDPAPMLSQRRALNLAGEGVVYHTEPFAAPVELSGFAKATLWLTLDVPDTDLAVELFEVLPDGRAIHLTDTVMRARYRDSLRKALPVPLGQPVAFVFDHFTFFSREVARNSRLRLLVTSLNSPSTEKNYNSGGEVARETGRDARTAHIRLLHEPGHESVLTLPVALADQGQ